MHYTPSISLCKKKFFESCAFFVPLFTLLERSNYLLSWRINIFSSVWLSVIKKEYFYRKFLLNLYIYMCDFRILSIYFILFKISINFLKLIKKSWNHTHRTFNFPLKKLKEFLEKRYFKSKMNIAPWWRNVFKVCHKIVDLSRMKISRWVSTTGCLVSGWLFWIGLKWQKIET